MRLRSLSIRTHLIISALLILAPVVSVGTMVSGLYESAEHERLLEEARKIAHESASLIEYELNAVRAALVVLATSSTLAEAQFERFDAKAREVLSAFPDSVIAVRRGSDAQQMVNTFVPWGAPLPRTQDPTLLAADRAALETGSFVVSGVYIGAAAKKPFVAMDIAVKVLGEPYVLNIALRADRIRDILLPQQVPGGWLIAVVDGNNRIVASTREHDRFVGSAATADFGPNTTGYRGMFTSVTLDGTSVLTTYEIIESTNWRVGAAIPITELERPLHHLWYAIAGLIITGVLTSTAFATAYGRHLVHAFRRLEASAAAIARHEIAEDFATRVRELDSLAQALAKASRDLQTMNSERASLQRQLISAQEQERMRLARELHDQTGQILTAAMLEAERVDENATPAARRQIRQLRNRLGDVSRILHRVAWELRPASLDELGLESALANYVSQWSEQCGIEADLICEDSVLDALPDDVRTTIYRVVQEALTNAAKHAIGASIVSITAARVGSMIHLTIEDNGCGFDVAASTQQNRLGIRGMRERLALLGGKLEIESQPGAGTTIFARIPIKRLTHAGRELVA
jgi:signal transduction histidine kinase